MVTRLGTHFEFFVITRDRDATDRSTYSGVTPNEWHRVGNAHVLYCSSITAQTLRRAYREVRPDVISLNSFQDRFTRVMIALRRLGVLGTTPVLLAPRGEFSPGAMEIKSRKKHFYRRAAGLLRLHANLLWQVSSGLELKHLLDAAPALLNPDSIHLTSEINDELQSTELRPLKEPGSVKLLYISRISEKKNLHFVIDLLTGIEGNVEFDIYGPIAPGDADYWDRCTASIKTLPRSVSVRYLGPLEHADVPQTLRRYHFFILPTRGENYCHAAVESFVNGTPAILSNQTPWLNLYALHAGFDISLNDKAGWINALQTCVAMGDYQYSEFSSGASEYGRRFSNEEAIRQHTAMFEAALRQKR